MAKKGYSSSYKEKVYYDNTVFRGIMATTDPNAEGYFKQLINFNIDDTGQSLIPRKGLLHTCFHLEDGTVTSFNPETTVYYKDQKTGHYIFIDMTSFYETYASFINMYNSLLQADIVLNPKTLETFLNNTYSGYLGALEDFNHGGDTDVFTAWYNTHYSGTNIDFYDAVNFMESLKQNYGTIIQDVYDAVYTIINTPLYHICHVPMGLSQKFFTAYPVETIEAIKTNSDDNTIYLYDKFPVISNIEIIGSHYAQYIVDDNLLGKNIIKVKINNTEYTWLEFNYNETNNTLVVSVTDIYSTYAIDMANRNLASDADIIPSPTAMIFGTTEQAHEANVWYNKFPIIYARKGDVYLLNYTDTLNGLEIVPSYFLLPPEQGYKWAYTYDILSTDPKATENSNNLIYNSSGIYDIVTNNTIDYPFYTHIYNTEMLQSFGISTIGNSYSASTLEDINTMYNTTDDILLDAPENRLDSTYIITVVPANINIISPPDIDLTVVTNGSTSINDDSNITKRLFTVLFGYDTTLSTECFKGFSFEAYTYNEFLSAEIPTYINSYNDLEMLITGSTYFTSSNYYITKCNDITQPYETFYNSTIYDVYKRYDTIRNNNTLNSYVTALNSPILITQEAPMTASELLNYIKTNVTGFANIIFKYMFTGRYIQINHTLRNKLYQDILHAPNFQLDLQGSVLSQLFPELLDPYETPQNANINTTIDKQYYIYTTLQLPVSYLPYMRDYDVIHTLFYEFTINYNSTGSTLPRSCYYPRIYKQYEYSTTNISDTIVKPYIHEIQYNIGYPLYKTVDTTNNTIYSILNTSNYMDLYNRRFFKQGLSIVFYIFQVPSSVSYSDLTNGTTLPSDYERLKLINSTNLIQSYTILFKDNSDNDKTNQIERTLTNEPTDIRTSNNYCIFNSTEGYRLVVWKDNIVYMSEALNYGYFKQDNKKTYPETVLKVLPYKDKLLVFTTQNMYAIFPYEYTTQVENGTDDEGNKKYVQQNIITYNTLPVLYNLYTDKKYLKVIQIYNSMVLYYSTQGQLYLIAPTATVDSDTMYTLKYMNQAANDILLNYDTYINNRLSVYKQEPITKDDVYIDADVSISYIKIFYSVPSRNYTYILFYDIVNNRYFVYDTNIFGTVENIIYTDIGPIVISHDWNNHISLCTYYNEPNITDNNYDMYTMDNYSFETQDINTEIDTGIIFLNNHLTKRFRSLSTTYKNLNASNLQYTLNLFVDNARLIHTVMGNNVEITNINDIIDNQKIITSAELLESNTVLFDFSEANSNKIVSHTTSIPSLGKNIELQLRFKSKGKYKLQGFGIVYKEHSV